MKKKVVLVLTGLTMVACDSKKDPLQGTRIDVVNYESSIKVDAETKGTQVILPPAEKDRDWPQISSAADHTIPHICMNESIKPLWSESIGSGIGEGRYLSSPIEAEGFVYALDSEGQVVALNATTGETLWTMQIAPNGSNQPIIGGGIAFESCKLFVTSPHAEVLALDAKTGNILWRVPTLSPVRAAPTVADGRVYVVNISNQLDVLDANTGKALWNHAGITEFAGLLGTASPAVSNGVAVVTYSSGEIFALKADNGHQLWTETLSSTRRPDSLSSLSHIRALPVIEKGNVIIIGHNQKMASYDIRRGERLWERHIGGTRTPAVLGGFIFMINSHNELVCLTREYGQVIWVKKLADDTENPIKVLWNGPIVAGGKLYAVSTFGQLVAINPLDGNILCNIDLGESVSLSPIAAKEVLYILTDSGEIKAFK